MLLSARITVYTRTRLEFEQNLIRLTTEQKKIVDHRPKSQCAYDDETQDRLVLNLVYVSITRAMEQFHLFTLEGLKA